MKLFFELFEFYHRTGEAFELKGNCFSGLDIPTMINFLMLSIFACFDVMLFAGV